MRMLPFVYFDGCRQEIVFFGQYRVPLYITDGSRPMNGYSLDATRGETESKEGHFG